MYKILFFIIFCISFSSCNDSETFSDKVKEEKEYLDKFTKEKGFIILSEFPKDSIFAKNEFILLNNGVYLHISDLGEGKFSLGDEIQTKAKGVFLDNGITDPFDGFVSQSDTIVWPLIFKYGDTLFSDKYLLSDGYTSALKYVGKNSVVSLIVPFEVGSYYQNTNTVSIYFEKVFFTDK